MESSKATNLGRLAFAADVPFVIDRFLVFSVSEWTLSSAEVVERIQAVNWGGPVAVRSSAAGEDSSPKLFPGMFRSKLGVRHSDEAELRRAIEDVIRSYEKDRENRTPELDEVIVQAQVVNPVLSGVAHARSRDGYCRIEYDDVSGSTSTVTSGQECASVEIIMDPGIGLPEPWNSVRECVRSVQVLLCVNNLILELAVTSDGLVHLFQARRFPGGEEPHLSEKAILRVTEARRALVAEEMPWSDMTDWNPAELLGERPKPLAFSLYRSLITDSAWLVGRKSLGYRDLKRHRLAESIAGKPYINVRSSFLSLTPASLNDRLAEKLTEDRLRLLRESPWLHDKVEMSLLFTAADVVLQPRTAVLADRGFSMQEIHEIDCALRTLTNSLVRNGDSWAREDLRSVDFLREPIDTSPQSPSELAGIILRDIERCRDYGVVPFARQARLAFVARDLLGRFREASAISREWEDQWWSSLVKRATRKAAEWPRCLDISVARGRTRWNWQTEKSHRRHGRESRH